MQTLGDAITWGLIIAALIVVPYKIAKAWLWPVVKDFFVSAPDVMSRSEDDDRPVALSALRQTAPTDNRPREVALISRDVMLDMFRLLREYNVPREKARSVLKAAGLPLDNNLWTAAAPDDDTHLTPIAGRPTKAQFEQDPDMAYEAPPR